MNVRKAYRLSCANDVYISDKIRNYGALAISIIKDVGPTVAMEMMGIEPLNQERTKPIAPITAFQRGQISHILRFTCGIPLEKSLRYLV